MAAPRPTRSRPGLADAVRALSWRDGRVDVFVHGEAQTVMQEIRPYLAERGVDTRAASISGYWKRGLVDEEFRHWKRSSPPPRPAEGTAAMVGRVRQS